MKENCKEQIFIQALSQAVNECLNGQAPSKFANEYGLSTSTMFSLVHSKKDFYITTIGKVAEGLNLKLSQLIAITEKYLPEDFNFLEY